MTKLPKNPFLAHLASAYGGSEYFRCKTLEQAKERCANYAVPGVVIVRRWVSDTKMNVIEEC